MKQLRFAPFDLPLIVFLLSAAAGLAVTYDPQSGLRTLIALAGMTVLYGFLSRAANSARRWDAFAAVLAVLGALAGFYFITQAGHIAYDDKIGLIDRAAQAIAAIFPAFPFWKPVANSLATFLESILFLTVGLALLAQGNGRRRLAWGMVAILAIGLVFTASRGAWLGVLGAGLLWAALHWKPARWLVFAAAAGLFGMVIFVIIRGDINALAEIPMVGQLAGALFMRPDRLEVYNHSLALLAEQPFTGIGLGDAFSMDYSRYELALAVPYLVYSHNLLLEIWLQQGLIGAAAFIWLAAALFTALAHRPDLKSDLRLQAAAAGLTATLLHGLVDARQYPSLWTWLPFFFLLGLCAARLLLTQPLPSPRLEWLLPAGATAIFLILALALTWPPVAAWNANRAGLLQIRAAFDNTLSRDQIKTMRSQSEDLFLRALAVDPGSPPIQRRYGLLLMEQERFSEAIPHLELAYQTKPNHVGARKSLGLAYMWTGDLDRAEKLLSGIPNITVELEGLAWREYNDFQHYQNALYTFLLLDRLEPGLDFTREMIDSLQRRLAPGK